MWHAPALSRRAEIPPTPRRAGGCGSTRQPRKLQSGIVRPMISRKRSVVARIDEVDHLVDETTYSSHGRGFVASLELSQIRRAAVSRALRGSRLPYSVLGPSRGRRGEDSLSDSLRSSTPCLRRFFRRRVITDGRPNVRTRAVATKLSVQRSAQ